MQRLFSVFLLVFPILLWSQSVQDLESRLSKATTKTEKMNVTFQLAQATLSSNPAKAADYAFKSSQFAAEVGDKKKECEAIYLSATALYNRSDYGGAGDRLKRAFASAKKTGLVDVAVGASEKLQEIALRNRNYNEALGYSKELVEYLKTASTGKKQNSNPAPVVNDLSSGQKDKYEATIKQLELEKRQIREELAKATGRTELLELNRQEAEAELKNYQERTKEELSKREEALSSYSVENEKTAKMLKEKDRMVRNLTKEQLADSVQLVKKETELQKQKLKAAESENLRNLIGLFAIFVLLLAILFYARFHAKNRMARQLADKNSLIETERQRSDKLLLNILPPAIAEELKQKNKVAAREYDKATVMFIDFANFTYIAEKLSPDMLVEELDYCFSNFDHIIGQYAIEKIKTIGDAYMCACGLSDMNASPSDMVKAALEIQDFLLHLKAERQHRNLPFFEARIGIHTGPVVAGVVGAKKFAYDIWGDTVNIAARMEQTCDPGKVNVSEDSYWLAKYEFDWQARGRIAAKNKGEMEMYYVKALKV